MNYQVPQFLDVEDKIVGPLTIKQFLFLAVGGGFLFFAFLVLRLGFALLIGLPVAALSFALAFFKVEGVPLARYLTSMIGFSIRPQRYLWKRK